MANSLPRTKIEIDVAHYIKNWCNSLRNEKKVVKKFYMFAIGQLILCKNMQDANNLIKALLILSMSETAGNGANSLKTSLEYVKSLIEDRTTRDDETAMKQVREIVEKSVDEEDEPSSHNGDNENPASNEFVYKTGSVLSNWSSTLKTEVEHIIKMEVGDDINPRFSPAFGTRLLKQIKTIPLWSCIRHEAFGYGRVPPSSAPVESEFKILKNQVLPSPLRIDMAVETINNYYNGKLKVIDCRLLKNQQPETVMEPPAASTFLEEDVDIDLANVSFMNNLDVSLDEALMNDIDLSSVFNNLAATKYDEDDRTCTDCKYGHHTQSRCTLCQGSIHLNMLCSVPLEDGENDTKRVCKNCFNTSRKDERAVFNEIENWRNLGKPDSRTKGLYLSRAKTQVLNDIVLNSQPLPILTNGNSPTLGFVKIGNRKLSLTNTCAFDSIFQIMLAAVTDNPTHENYVETYQQNNSLFKLVMQVKSSRIQQATYKQRAAILLQFLKLDKIRKSNILEKIDASCNVISLANFLFKNSPSFQAASECLSGCPLRVKLLPTITILGQELQEPLNLVLKKYIGFTGVKCNQSKCNETCTNKIYEIADIIAIGIDTECSFSESLIPKNFNCPLTNYQYNLLGVVNYKGPTVMSRSEGDIGHYTAVTLRYGHWTVYDDTKKQPYTLKTNTKLHPELIFYGKCFTTDIY